MRKFLLLLVLVGACFFSVAFSCGSNPSPTLPEPTAGGGFILETEVSYYQGSPAVPEPLVDVAMAWQSDDPGAAGDAGITSAATNDVAVASLLTARAPAKWKFTWQSSYDGPPNCVGVNTIIDVPLNALAEFICQEWIIQGSAQISTFGFSPNPVYINSTLPSSGTVLGSGFSSSYGMPLVQYYNLDGTLVAEENATSVASNGDSIQISGFDISQLPVGTYAAFVSNAASGGAYTYLGAGDVRVANGGVDLSGVEQSKPNCLKPARSGCLEWGPTIYDSGTVSITINGIVSSVPYGEYSTTWTIASALASAINSNSSINSLVLSVPDVYAVLLDIKSGSGYSLSASATTNDKYDFPSGSFTTGPSGSTF